MKGSVLKKAVSAVIILSMLLSILPTTNVFAASIADKYSYKIRVKNGDVKYAGTDSEIYCIVESVSGQKFQEKIDSGSNDFERNDDRTYTVNLKIQPWEIKYVGLKNGGKDGANIAWFKFKLPNETWIHQDVYAWIEKGNTAERTYLLWSETDRQVKSRDNFDNNFSGTKYFDAAATTGNNIVMEWSGRVSDQYFSNYNMFGYAGAVGVTFNATGKSYNGLSSITSVSQMEDNSLAEIGNKDGFDNKLTIKTSELLRFMKNNKIYKLDIKSEIDYESKYDEYSSHSENYTIYRKGFELQNASAITAAYTPEKDNYFYNSDAQYKEFRIKIPVKEMDNYSAVDIAKTLAANIKSGTSPAKVYHDTVESGAYITPYDVYNSGRDIFLKCRVPENYANNGVNGAVGITVVIENAKATYSGQTYTLDRDNAGYKYYISTHKVDTKGLTHTLMDESDGVITGFDTYAKEHKFKFAVEAGQSIYMDDTAAMRNQKKLRSDNSVRSDGYFSYKLFSEDKKNAIPLKKHNGVTDTEQVPHAGNSIYKIAATEDVEGIYQLEIASRDFANNLVKTYYPVKLDTLAPRATYTLKEVKGVDGSKSNQYKFDITDASGTGRLNYVFVYNSDPIPDPDATLPEESGTVASTIGKWAFIDQKNPQAQTAVLYLPEDKFFEGKLYWYTVDEAGNDSRDENHSGTTSEGYFSADATLYNVSADCEITLDDITPGKPQYDIGFVTSESNRVEYKWMGNGLVTNHIPYSGSSKPGAAEQKDSAGKRVVMNGNYVLEYVVITPDGQRTTYTRDFVFDNTNPEITFGGEKESIGSTKRLSIYVKDISNISELKYQLVTSDEEPVGEEVELSAGLPVVSHEITVSPEKTGAYKVKVKATDVNGQSYEAYSDVFSIRNAAPAVTVENNITSKHYEYPITNSQDYSFTISAEEAVNNVSDFAGEQAMFYRTSPDGINYTDWSKTGAVKYTGNNGDGHRASINITSPVALNNGENRIYVQVAFAERDADTSRLRNDIISTNDETVIIYDTQAPQYKISLDTDEMTNKNVFGTVTYTDNYTHANRIEFKNNNYFIDNTPTSMSEDVAVQELEIITNVENNIIYLKDAAGNETAIPITVKCIDTAAPDYEVNYEYQTDIGERHDYYASFTIDKAMDGQTQFALVEGAMNPPRDPSDTSKPAADHIQIVQPYEIDDSLFGPMPDMVELVNTEFEYDYDNGETKTRYDIIVRGDETVKGEYEKPNQYDYIDSEAYNQAYNDWVAGGEAGAPPTKYDYIDYEAYNAAFDVYREEYERLNYKYYVLAVKTFDALGNTTKDGLTVSTVNATSEIVEVWCYPQKASSKTALVIQTNVPAYVVPQDKVPAEITALNLPDGRIDNSENAVVVAFAEDVVNSATGYSMSSSAIIDSLGEKTVYFADECGRVYKQTVTVKDEAEKSDDDDVLTAYVSFGYEVPVDVKLYRAMGDDLEISNWTEIALSATDVLDFAAGFNYYVVLTPKAATESNKTVSVADYGNKSSIIDEETGFGVEDFEIVDELSLYSGDEYTYSQLVYKICDTANPNKLFGYAAKIVTTDPNGLAEDIEEFVGTAFEINLKDVTGPEIDASYSRKGYTNEDVIVTVSASDPELMTNTDAADTNSAGEDPTSGAEAELKEFTAEQLADSAGIRKIEISDISEDDIDESEYQTLTYNDAGKAAQTSVTFTENGYAVVKATNSLGLVSYKKLEVANINKAAIEEGTHYNIRYYIDGGETETEVNPDAYYKDVIAKVEFTQAGIDDRELYVSNNMGETEKHLDSFDNEFTFELADKFGNTKDVYIVFDKFDMDGPVLSYEPSVTRKTNQNFDVYIKAYDLLNAVTEIPSVTGPDGEELTVTAEGEETAGEITKKVFKTSVEKSGVYRVAAKDILGNISYLNFVISNIDKTKPVITERMYTSTEQTRQTVGVKLYYSKPGVVITEAEGVSVAAKDFVVDYSNSAIRFHENGTVAVKFVDEYGNEGTDSVTVENINRTPPSVKAVITPSADLLSVDVSFVQQTDGSGLPLDTKRQLSDLYTLYGGITPIKTELDEDGNEVDKVLNASEVKYTFIDNGTYKIYVYDSIGNLQELDVEITEIDKRAPVITNVAWSYKYLDENGTEQTVNYTVVPGDEAGYNAVEDATYRLTNQDITATVTTDLATRFVGSDSDEFKTENSIVYSEDGWFNFDLERQNSLMDRYGLGLYLIDKEPPVIEEVEDLMFFENPNAGTPYDKALLKYSAYDERYGEKTNLTDKVEIDWGGFNPDDFYANKFDKSKPYTITYTVKDKVGNETQVRRTITLVGLFDAIARVNGIYPDSSGRIEIIGDSIEIGIDNFSGTAYARYEKGIHTMGQMKHIGTVIPQNGDKFKVEKLSEGWYTFYVQTDLRDYFCINVYIYNK